MSDPDYRHPYLTSSLIAYLGNKRSLLPFLGRRIAACAEKIAASGTPRFLDPFAGSGAVSRLARFMGFRVAANDLELYAALIARSRIGLDPAALAGSFADEGGGTAAFAALQAFAAGAEPDSAVLGLDSGEGRRRWRDAFADAEKAAAWLGRHYAPRRTAEADWRSERLFYTAENAGYLDRAREAVEQRYPGPAADLIGTTGPEADAKAALIDALLYQAATHTNTSGVFKACHRGFGGHGGDALGRILAPMAIAPPILAAGPPGSADRLDAAAFCARRSGDIAYLDPPYNQHQYGSNYHLLTSIAKWDKPPVPEDRREDGFLINRSGIRPDWTETRSDFCRRGKAAGAFARLLAAVDARFILVSYNDGGILDQDELSELLAARGEPRREEVPYTAYRGGKQSDARIQRTREFLFVVDTADAGRRTRGRPLREGADRQDLDARIAALLAGRFVPERVRRTFPEGGFAVLEDGRCPFPPDGLTLVRWGASTTEKSAFLERLEACACASAEETLAVLLAALESRTPGPRLDPPTRALVRDILGFLRKVAFLKYARVYRSASARLRTLLSGGGPAFASLLERLDRLDGIARKRGVGSSVPENVPGKNDGA